MILQANNLCKTFVQNTQVLEVLKDISLQVEKKDSLAIVGPSGSGKSTLLSILAALDRPTSGEVLFKGQDLYSLNEKDLALWRRQEMSMVFQQFHLFPHLTALENVMVPLEFLKAADTEAKAQRMLERVGLQHRLHHLPSTLSGGEAQRVAIARALVHRPQLILADEPSGNLDVQTGERVMQLFFDLIAESEATVILVTHNIELASRCQQKLVLH